MAKCSHLEQYDPHIINDDDWYPHEIEFVPNVECKAKFCIDIKASVEMALKRNFNSRKSYIDLFQAQLNTIAKLSNILPHIDLSLGNGQYPINAYGVLSNLVGFLIPSHWFDWGESLYLYKAQGYLYIHDLLNIAYATQLIYYIFNLNIIDYYIYQYYQENLSKVLFLIEENPNDYIINLEDLLVMKQYNTDLELQMLEIRKVVEEEIGNFAYFINYKGDWHNLGIKTITPPDISHDEYANIDEWIDVGLKNSNLAVSIYYKIKAAHFARASRAFSFFSIAKDGTIGLNFSLKYISDIIVSSNDINRLKIELEECRTDMKKMMWELAHNNNTAIDIFKKSKEAKIINGDLLKMILVSYQQSKKISRSHILSSISNAIKFERIKNRASHLSLISQIEYDFFSDKTNQIYKIYKKIPKRIVPTPQTNYSRWLEDEAIRKRIEKE